MIDNLSSAERQLLEKLAQAGAPTELLQEELVLAKLLEHRGLLHFLRNSATAVILPKGRHALSGVEPNSPQPAKRPLGFLA
jgi:hypothetical protein